MKKVASFGGLLFTLTHASWVFADQEPAQNSLVESPKCVSESALQRMSEEQRQACLKNSDDKVERVLVYGRFLGLQVPEIEGRFTLDREFIDSAPRTGGDFTELLGLLPGIQLGSEFLEASEQGEIQAQRVSIMGAQPWQTGFFIDGINFNSRQDPNSFRDGSLLINDVSGTTQAFNVNQQIIESMTVYTNNVPAKYGSFSGGVVDVETRSTFAKKPTFGINYRTSQSDWNQYRVLIDEDDTGNSALVEPAFEKKILNLNFSTKLGEHHGVLFSMNHTTSDITELSLNESVNTSRENANFLVKLTQTNLWVDEITATFNYSPYESNDVLRNVLDSDFRIEGGGYSSVLRLKHGFDSFSVNSRLSYTQSYNSRYAPPHYYPWAKATGRDWGVGSRADEASSSNQGGYGDIEKTQTTIISDTEFKFNEFTWLGAEHIVSAGIQYNNESLERERFYDTYRYNAPDLGIINLDCNGHVFDCVETQQRLTDEELEEVLGGPIDFLNPDHVLAVAENTIVAAQYFGVRTVYPREYIDVNVQNFSAYVSDSMDLGKLTLNVSARADYDDFLQNLNIAPRISGGYRLFDDNNALVTFGLNRYYDSQLLSYAVREAQLPYFVQERATIDRPGADPQVGSWLPTLNGDDFRYRFDDIKTPFNDELVLGWKQATPFGNYSIEYVKRWSKDQLVFNGDPIYNPTDGFFYRQQNNDGSGYNDSIALSWSWAIDNHSLWLNTSYQISQEYSDNQEEDVTIAGIDDLIILRTGSQETGFEFEESTLSNLNLASSEFARPISVNFGWASRWTDTITTNVTGTYREAYQDYVRTDENESSVQIARVCSSCDANDLLLVPVYQLVDLPTRILVNASMSWKPKFADNQNLTFRIDVQNLFDSRTYSVAPGNSGIETGRSLWFEVGYQWQ